MFDVITVGSNTLDVFVTTDAELVKVSIHENVLGKKKLKKEPCLVYPLGAKLLIKELNFEIGGGGTNTAVSFSRLKLKTGYIGKIGHDDGGVQVFNMLHRENIEFLGAFGKETGYSVILDSDAQDRTILTFKGCNDDLRFVELKKNLLKTKWFYFSSMTGESFKTLMNLSKFANSNKINIVFNPSRYLVSKGIKYLTGILRNTDVLILNREEAEILSDKKELKDILVFLKNIIKKYVVVTDGKKGCWCFDGVKVIRAVPRKNIKIVETTGAGDAFASAFTAGLIMKQNLKNCIRMGMIQSESVIRYKGAKNILLSYKAMGSLLKKDKRRINEYLLS